MTPAYQIRQFTERVVNAFRPERIILFGSHATGRATEDSDVDLLIIMRCDKNPTDQALEIRRRIDCLFPLDLIVKTPEETRRRLSAYDVFLTSIVNEGRTLYERNRH